ncbi:ABC transporter substrate-binding protein [Microbacterium sp. Marseille-Q6965]|uniref:ABC transporter substrate-binding protein n=1 Tax=Microbacterium sp. Marseille-Q6965 TaxID=2965072 RepID=UPI0021B7747F|nr:extracellular solute-binding protein [Microbacterium sp. Marseille-Q6965]
MRYRVVGTALVGLLAVGMVAGCSNDTTGGGNGGSGDALTFASVTSDKPAAEAVAAAFTEETGIEITLTTADTDDYQTTLRTQLSSGTAPDVFFVWPGDGNPMALQVVAEAGLVEDLSDMDFVEKIPEAYRVLSDFEDGTYVAPVSSAGIGAAYNLTVMEEVGLEVPQTWTEVLTLCADAQAAGKAAFALAGQTPWQVQLIPYALTPTLVYGPNPDFAQQMADGEATFADSEWTTAFEKYIEMNEAGCFQDSALGTGYEDALDLVAKGEALASVQVNASVEMIRQGAPEGTELRLEPLPATDDPAETRMAAAMGAGYSINVGTEKGEQARQFIEFLTSEEGQRLYADSIAGIPALDPEYEVDPALEPLMTYMAEGKTDPFMDQLWPNPNVQQVHLEVDQQLLAGDITVEEALARMDEAYAAG